MTAYRVVSGPSIVKDDTEAQAVGEFFDKQFGDDPITPSGVVEVARPARSPIHRFFEWDDAAAAEAHRQNQARALLRSITVIREDVPGPTRAYHNVQVVTDSGLRRTYLSHRVIWSSPELSGQVVDRALSELRQWRQRWVTYRELDATIAVVDQVLS